MKKGKTIISTIVVSMMVLTSITPALAYSKDETVYTKLDATGKEKVTIVSEHLKNDDEEKILQDVSTLSNIFNVNGDEGFKQDGQKLSWQALGNDIYYQGKTTQKLPITMKISYKFNGKETTVDKMIGKKGTVEICIKYINNVKENDLYVPFVVTTGMILPTNKNSNVEVTNGKVVSNGSNNIIIALAAPGLAEDYDNNEKLQGLDEVVIKYKTKKFSLKSLVSAATPGVLSTENMRIFDQMNDIDTMMKDLMASYAKLQNGGQDLRQGVDEFSSKYSDFDSGINDLNNGINVASDGVKELNSGINALSQGLQQLDSHSLALTDGAKQTFNVLLSTATAQLQASGLEISELTISNYNKVLNDVLEKIAGVATVKVTSIVKEEVTKQVTHEVDQQVETMIDTALKQQDEQIKAQVKQAMLQTLVSGGLTQEEANYYLTTNEGKEKFDQQYQTTIKTLKKQKIEEYKQSTQYQELIATNVQTQMNSKTIQDKIKQLVAQNTTGDNANAYMQVFNLQVQLDTFKQFYVGIQEYTKSVGKLKDGAKQVLSGSEQLTQGVIQVQSGTNVLTNASSQLNNASKLLKMGSETLASGLIQFNEQGLSKITDVVTNVLMKDVDKTEKLINLANEYKTFAGSLDNVEASTKFVMITESKSK